jgi:hypothetical protein
MWMLVYKDFEDFYDCFEEQSIWSHVFFNRRGYEKKMIEVTKQLTRFGE